MLRITRAKLQFKELDKVINHPNSILSGTVGSGAAGYRRVVVTLVFPAFLFCFNAGIWQIFRRREKIQALADMSNLHADPLRELPTAENPGAQMQPMILEGVFDNEGSCLVGPLPQPNLSIQAKGDNTEGGFFVMTPFEVAHTRQVVMVNRGWVPLDAAKSRLHLVQYIGEGFKKHRLRGILRRQQTLTTTLTGAERPENYGPRAGGMSWEAFRPTEMAMAYYRRRFGTGDLIEREELHGTHTFYVEMIEDQSGDDQVIIKDQVFPFRRDSVELKYQKLSPIGHLAYAAFWLSMSFFLATTIYGFKGIVNGKIQASKRSTAMDLHSKQSMKASKEAYIQSDAYKEGLAQLNKASSFGRSKAPDTTLNNTGPL